MENWFKIILHKIPDFLFLFIVTRFDSIKKWTGFRTMLIVFPEVCRRRPTFSLPNSQSNDLQLNSYYASKLCECKGNRKYHIFT